MTTPLEQYWLNNHITKFTNPDLFDNQEIDKTLSYQEKKAIITDKLRILLSPQEQIDVGLYNADDAQTHIEIESRDWHPHDTKPLTKKQYRVLELLLEGKSQREIAKAIGTARGTIKKHFMAIKKKGYAVPIGYNRYHYFKAEKVWG